MGNIFARRPLALSNPELIEHLKSKKITDINDVIETLDCYYQLQQSLNLQEFTDAFQVFLEGYTQQFFIQMENSHSADGQVDVYESLAVLTIYCQGQYDDKLLYLFALFDFDKSKSLQKQELHMVYQTGIRALCKIANLQLPSYKELDAFAECAFSFIDKDNNKAITEEEFRDFMNNQPDLQDFLLKHAQIQTKPNALRRFNEFFSFYGKMFQGELFVKIQDLKPRLEARVKENTDFLLKIMADTSQFYDKSLPPGLILKSAFDHVMRAWSAFEATDINSDQQLNLKEMEFLLFAYEGEEPSLYRLNEEMKQLDRDKSGTVSKLEWISFLCVSKENQGKAVMRESLRQKFRQYDIDNSGQLDRQELRKMLLDSFKDVESKFSQKSKQEYEEFQGMIYSLSDQILEGIHEKDQTDNVVSQLPFLNDIYR